MLFHNNTGKLWYTPRPAGTVKQHASAPWLHYTVSAAGGAVLEGDSGAGTDLLTAANGLLPCRPPAAAATAAATAGAAPSAAGPLWLVVGMPSISGGGAPTSCSIS